VVGLTPGLGLGLLHPYQIPRSPQPFLHNAAVAALIRSQVNMAADKLLATLLRSLRTYTDQQDTPRLLGTAASLLTNLQNPLNISLLTNQLLVAPALWHRPEGLQTCLRLMGVFHSAAVQLLRREEQDAQDSQAQLYQTPQRGMEKEAWVRAVMKGADEKSPTWKHTIVAAGLLLGFGAPEDERLGWSLRHSIDQLLVQSVNISLGQIRQEGDEIAGHCITLALNHTFAMLPDFERSILDYNVSVSRLVWKMLTIEDVIACAAGQRIFLKRRPTRRVFSWIPRVGHYPDARRKAELEGSLLLWISRLC
jgi:hypothetical protein